jgi:putative flippase GtrA
MAASLMDYIIFIIGYWVAHNVLISLVFARLVGVICYFLLNKYFVFHSHKKFFSELLNYSFVCVIMVFVTYFGINFFVSYLNWGVIWSKFFIEATLFFVNFLAMRFIVFSNQEDANDK